MKGKETRDTWFTPSSISIVSSTNALPSLGNRVAASLLVFPPQSPPALAPYLSLPLFSLSFSLSPHIKASLSVTLGDRNG